jgi:hypothetical protein
MAEKGHTGYRAIRAITIHKKWLKGILLAHIANMVEFIDIKTQAIHPKSYESFISTSNRHLRGNAGTHYHQFCTTRSHTVTFRRERDHVL